MDGFEADKRSLSVIEEEVFGFYGAPEEEVGYDLDEVRIVAQRGVVVLSQAFCGFRRLCQFGMIFGFLPIGLDF